MEPHLLYNAPLSTDAHHFRRCFMPDYPEAPFLEWEYRLYLDLLKLPLAKFTANEATYNAAIKYKRKLTINQFRKQIPEVTLHPDERGEKYVFDLAEERDGDNKIPAEALIGSWNKLVVDTNTKPNRPKFAELKAFYNDLYAAAKATGGYLLENYPTPDPEQPKPPTPEALVKVWNDIVVRTIVNTTGLDPKYRPDMADLKLLYVDDYEAAKATGLPIYEDYSEVPKEVLPKVERVEDAKEA